MILALWLAISLYISILLIFDIINSISNKRTSTHLIMTLLVSLSWGTFYYLNISS